MANEKTIFNDIISDMNRVIRSGKEVSASLKGVAEAAKKINKAKGGKRPVATRSIKKESALLSAFGKTASAIGRARTQREKAFLRQKLNTTRILLKNQTAITRRAIRASKDASKRRETAARLRQKLDASTFRGLRQEIKLVKRVGRAIRGIIPAKIAAHKRTKEEIAAQVELIKKAKRLKKIKTAAARGGGLLGGFKLLAQAVPVLVNSMISLLKVGVALAPVLVRAFKNPAVLVIGLLLSFGSLVSATSKVNNALNATGAVIASLIPTAGKLFSIFAGYQLIFGAAGQSLQNFAAIAAKTSFDIARRFIAIREDFVRFEESLGARFGLEAVDSIKDSFIQIATELGIPLQKAIDNFTVVLNNPDLRRAIKEPGEAVNTALLEKVARTIQVIQLTQPDIAARFGQQFTNIVSGDSRSFAFGFETTPEKAAKDIKQTRLRRINEQQDVLNDRGSRLVELKEALKGDEISKNTEKAAKINAEIAKLTIQQTKASGKLVELFAQVPATLADFKSGNALKAFEFVSQFTGTLIDKSALKNIAQNITVQTEVFKNFLGLLVNNILKGPDAETSPFTSIAKPLFDFVSSFGEKVRDLKTGRLSKILVKSLGPAAESLSLRMQAITDAFLEFLEDVTPEKFKNFLTTVKQNIQEVFKSVVSSLEDFFGGLAKSTEFESPLVSKISATLSDAFKSLGNATLDLIGMFEEFKRIGRVISNGLARSSLVKTLFDRFNIPKDPASVFRSSGTQGVSVGAQEIDRFADSKKRRISAQDFLNDPKLTEELAAFITKRLASGDAFLSDTTDNLSTPEGARLVIEKLLKEVPNASFGTRPVFVGRSGATTPPAVSRLIDSSDTAEPSGIEEQRADLAGATEANQQRILGERILSVFESLKASSSEPITEAQLAKAVAATIFRDGKNALPLVVKDNTDVTTAVQKQNLIDEIPTPQNARRVAFQQNLADSKKNPALTPFLETKFSQTTASQLRKFEGAGRVPIEQLSRNEQIKLKGNIADVRDLLIAASDDPEKGQIISEEVLKRVLGNPQKFTKQAELLADAVSRLSENTTAASLSKDNAILGLIPALHAFLNNPRPADDPIKFASPKKTAEEIARENGGGNNFRTRVPLPGDKGDKATRGDETDPKNTPVRSDPKEIRKRRKEREEQDKKNAAKAKLEKALKDKKRGDITTVRVLTPEERKKKIIAARNRAEEARTQAEKAKEALDAENLASFRRREILTRQRGERAQQRIEEERVREAKNKETAFLRVQFEAPDGSPIAEANVPLAGTPGADSLVVVPMPAARLSPGQ